MIQVEQLESVEQWETCLENSERRPLFVFKHSTSCPVSAEAYEQFKSYLQNGNVECDYTLVHVIESRPVSSRIAETLGVKHQSPQAILVKNGDVVWHDSHWRITSDKLREIVDTI